MCEWRGVGSFTECSIHLRGGRRGGRGSHLPVTMGGNRPVAFHKQRRRIAWRFLGQPSPSRRPGRRRLANGTILCEEGEVIGGFFPTSRLNAARPRRRRRERRDTTSRRYHGILLCRLTMRLQKKMLNVEDLEAMLAEFLCCSVCK